MQSLVNLREISHRPLPATEALALDVLNGFSVSPKRIPSKYLYDAKGSQLFAKITDCSDYYPTAKETEIFERHGRSICNNLNLDQINLIELGAGDGRKTQHLLSNFSALGGKVHYLPIDISSEANEALAKRVSSEFKSFEVTAVVAEYFQGIRWITKQISGPNVVFFLGSSIGNFTVTETSDFLRTLWACLNHGDKVLLGFDLKKDVDTLLKAYNDEGGVTREFNLNLLDRLNRDLGAKFDRRKFSHYGTYNAVLGAMESYLISLERQDVYVQQLKKSFTFKAFEPIHTEYSFKYNAEEMEELSKAAGFETVGTYFDENRDFCDAILKVVKH